MLRVDINEAICAILSDSPTAKFHGKTVGVDSVRLRTFATKGTDCICCGRKGKYFKLDYNPGFGHHLNLYAIGSDNKEKLMTRDHIQCHSHGGSDTVENMNTMCSRCNGLRGTQKLESFLEDWKNGVYDSRKEEVTGNKRSKTISEKFISEFSRNIDAYYRKDPSIALRDILSNKVEVDIESCLRSVPEEAQASGRILLMCWNNMGRYNRRKARVHFLGVYGEHVDMSPDKAFGVLMTLSRNQLRNPTEENTQRLFTHLCLCKRLRNA